MAHQNGAIRFGHDPTTSALDIYCYCKAHDMDNLYVVDASFFPSSGAVNPALTIIYPQVAFPYARLVEENRRRGREAPEYELLDTGVFDEDRYFDVFVEYAKGTPEDLPIRIQVVNRGPETTDLHLLPTIWFRNTWA